MPDDAADRELTFIERARRGQIVDAAIAVIAEEGFRRATFARIAARAEISPGLISYHFGSKDELFRHVLTVLEERFDAEIAAALEGAESYVDALRLMIEVQVRYTSSGRVEALALGRIHGEGSDAGGLRPTADDRTSWVDEVESMLRDGQREGEFVAFETRPMAATIIAALMTAPGELRRDPDRDPDVYARELADLFVIAATTKRRRRR